jgi:hypothetical protein
MTEFWVMKVIASRAQLDALKAQALAMGKANAHPFPVTPPWYAAYERGELQLVNGDICEAIAVYEAKTQADVAKAQGDATDRSLSEASKTGATHKVVMNAEV